MDGRNRSTLPGTIDGRDVLTPDTRKVLDILGNNGHIIEWRQTGSRDTVDVVFPDETAATITVRTCDDNSWCLTRKEN